MKKEDGFLRLNLSKINQNWHQILRKTKCKDMKDEVEVITNVLLSYELIISLTSICDVGSNVRLR